MKEIYNSIKILQEKFPKQYRIIVNKLYESLIMGRFDNKHETDSSVSASVISSNNTNSQKSVKSNFQTNKNHKLINKKQVRKSTSQDENNSLPSVSSDSDRPPPLQGIQKEVIQRFRPTPTKYQVQQQFQRMKQKKQLNISGQVYNRFAKSQDKNQKNAANKLKGQNEQNLRRVEQWKIESNKEYRLYANKVVPRFPNKNQELKYYNRRYMATTFSLRGYRLDRVQKIYQQKMSPLYPQCSRRRTASVDLVKAAYYRLQLFLKEDMKKNIRSLTNYETKFLYAVILTAHERFTPQEYDCFRKFVKVTFDLGSVSIRQRQAIKLFQAIQLGLRQKIQQGCTFQGQNFRPLPVKNIPFLDIYAPKQQGGYQQLIDIDSESISLDLQEENKEQQLQLLDEVILQIDSNCDNIT